MTWVEQSGHAVTSFSPVWGLVHVWWSSVEITSEPSWPAYAASTALAVCVALVWDRLWGEPPTWMHPVVAMGKALQWMAHCVAPTHEPYNSTWHFWKGAIAWCIGAAVVFVLYTTTALCWFESLPWWMYGLVTGVLLKPLLAWNMLRQEVGAVESALQISLEAGRQRLSWLVSRYTQQLDASVVRESAIETLAENLCDSVVAPLFWFVVAGLPGAALYRWANTADAMWGYQGWRGQGANKYHWQWAGKWTARADDALNWLPARLTAGLLALVGGGVSLKALRRDASVTPSPNGGWSMGAMAQVLGVQLRKPGVYILNPGGKSACTAAMVRALNISGRVVGVLFAVSCLVCLWFALGVANG